MRRLFAMRLLLGAFLSTAVCLSMVRPTNADGPVPADTETPAVVSEIIAARQALMRQMSDRLLVLARELMPKKTPVPCTQSERLVRQTAADLAKDVMRIEAAFSSRDTSKGSRTFPRLWDNWEEFIGLVNGMHVAATQLAEVKEGEPMNPLIVSVIRGCDACHLKFEVPSASGQRLENLRRLQ